MKTPVTYDGLADWYDEHLAPFTALATEPICSLLGVAHGRVVDIGCGGGVHIPPLLARGWDVTGVDLSVDQLRVARARAGRDVSLVEADATALPFEDDEFDAAISAFTHTA